jgi:G3E family GTPase
MNTAPLISGQPTIDVAIVTGFLGTGKTSLILGLLEGCDTRRTGVIVNEAGDTGFDGIQIAEATGDGSSIHMLGNGCLCCEGADDLGEALRALVERHIALTGEPSERIIVETSGLARPGKLLRQFQAITDLRLRVHIVATIDATLTANPDQHSEIVAQWAAAASLVLTRDDLAADGGVKALKLAQAINPLGQVFRREQAPEAFMASAGLKTTIADDMEGHGKVRAMTLRQSPIATWDDCTEWLDNLCGMGGERILRIKGLLRPASGNFGWLVQAVGTTFAVPVPISVAASSMEDGHIVVIGEALSSDWFATIEPSAIFLPHQKDHVHV